MVNSTKRKYRYATPVVTEPNKTAPAVWKQLIEGCEKTPQPWLKFVLEYLREQYQQQHPDDYAKYRTNTKRSQHT